MLQKQVASICRPFHRTLTRARLGGGGGDGYSLILPRRVYAAEQGLVFRVSSLKQGIQFHKCPDRGFLFEPEAFERWALYTCGTYTKKYVSRKILFSDVSLENYFTVFVERIETGSWNKVSSEMNDY